MAEHDEFRAPGSRTEEERGSQQYSESGALKDKLQSEAQNVKEKLRQEFEQTRERGKRAIETIEHQMEEKPLMSLLVAFGAGFLLGKSLPANDKLSGGIQSLKDKFESRTQNVKDKLESRTQNLQNVKDKLESRTQNVKEKLRQGFDQTRERGKRTVETARHQIEEKPLMSLIATFGVAFFIGKLLSRSGRQNYYAS